MAGRYRARASGMRWLAAALLAAMTLGSANLAHGSSQSSIDTSETACDVLTVDPLSGCELRFVDQPADAQKGTAITSAPADPDGDPVTVEVVNRPTGKRLTLSTAAITVEIADDASPGGDAVLGGTTTRNAVAGVATFDDLRIDAAGLGYTLRATSEDHEPATSDSFGIWDRVKNCAGGQACDVTVTDPGTMGVAVTGRSTTDGALLVALGVVDLDCGDSFNHAPRTATVDTVNFDGEKQATITIPKEIDQAQPNNGVNHYEICYEGDAPFTDRDGNTVHKGLLALCGPRPEGPLPPCLASRTKTGRGDVLLGVDMPAGDPNMT